MNKKLSIMNEKGKFKKLAAVVASAAVVMGMMAASTVSMAADYNNAAIKTDDVSLNIPKTLVAKNANLTKVDGPGLTYSYTIAPQEPAAGNGGTTITDKESPSHTGSVHAGPADGVTLTTSSVAFPVGTELNASASGTDNTKNIVASVDLSKFGTQAGIYRYKITESASATPSSVGVTDEDASEVRYLDVYIIRNASDALEVSGYVVHTGTTEDGAPSEKKTFDNSVFQTYNITLKKTVEGSMGDRGHQFGFAGTVVDNGRSFYAKKSEAPDSSADNKVDGAGAGSGVNTTLSHNQVYYISGLTDQATVTYTETNNTSDEYQVLVKNGSDTAVNSSAVAAGSTKVMPARNAKDSASAVEFVNTLDDVSPTGVLFRYGAPLLILVAAGALFVLNRRSKKASDLNA